MRNVLNDSEIKDALDSADFSKMVTADDYQFICARAIEEAVVKKFKPVIESARRAVEKRTPDGGYLVLTTDFEALHERLETLIYS